MKREEVIIGQLELHGQLHPILLCETLSADRETAVELVALLGYPAEEVEFQPSRGLPFWPEYTLN